MSVRVSKALSLGVDDLVTGTLQLKSACRSGVHALEGHDKKCFGSRIITFLIYCVNHHAVIVVVVSNNNIPVLAVIFRNAVELDIILPLGFIDKFEHSSAYSRLGRHLAQDVYRVVFVDVGCDDIFPRACIILRRRTHGQADHEHTYQY